MTPLDTIVNIPGDLLAYAQIEPSTFYTALQLMDERCAPEDTPERRQRRAEWYYTADGHGYSVERDKVEWSITDEKNNLVLQDLDNAFRELTTTKNYLPRNEAAEVSRSATSTLRIDMSSLRLSGNDNEWCYLSINTKTGHVKSGDKYVALNDTERAVLDRLGYTAANLAELDKAGIPETRVYVLNPTYITTEVAKDPEKRTSLWRASRLSDFNSNSYFDADSHNVNDLIALRGVRRDVIREADASETRAVPSAPVAPSEITPARCYDILLADPTGAAAVLDDSNAAGLSRILADYLAAKAQ